MKIATLIGCLVIFLTGTFAWKYRIAEMPAGNPWKLVSMSTDERGVTYSRYRNNESGTSRMDYPASMGHPSGYYQITSTIDPDAKGITFSTEGTPYLEPLTQHWTFASMGGTIVWASE